MAVTDAQMRPVDAHRGVKADDDDDEDDVDVLAGLDPGPNRPTQHDSLQVPANTSVWRISEAQRDSLASRTMEASIPSWPALRLPSRQALTRYFQSYSDMFHKHYPMLHMPTYSI